ncbi:MAG: hypothetical protein VXY93_12160, partial [Pseudomonadota bacterium]|nr:hypothetical protein [Pseudomonadota bacterium]
MALTDLTRISTSGIATGSTIDAPILRKDVSFRGTQVGVTSALFDSSDNALEFNDNVSIKFGTGGDGAIKHTGSNLQIQETTGNIQIVNYANDKDVVISTDDGSGGTASYFKADGSTGQVELYHYGTKRFETTSTGAQVTGNLNVTGVLTYDDVTNIDSLGIVTARTGVDVNAGGINVDGGGLNIVGVSTFANNIDANGDLDVDGHTELDNVSVVGTTTITQSDQTILALRVVGNTQFQGAGNSGDVTFVGAGNYNLAWDKSGNNLDFDDGVKARFGSNNRLQISSGNTLARFRLEGGVPLTISKSTTEDIAKFIPDGAVELYHNNTK